MELRKIGCEIVHWIQLLQGKIQWLISVNVANELSDSIKSESVWSNSVMFEEHVL
jgi:hypothetical protein